MEKVRMPNPIYVNAFVGKINPYWFTLDQAIKIHEWIGRIITWHEQNNEVTK